MLCPSGNATRFSVLEEMGILIVWIMKVLPLLIFGFDENIPLIAHFKKSKCFSRIRFSGDVK